MEYIYVAGYQNPHRIIDENGKVLGFGSSESDAWMNTARKMHNMIFLAKEKLTEAETILNDT